MNRHFVLLAAVVFFLLAGFTGCTSTPNPAPYMPYRAELEVNCVGQSLKLKVVR